MTTTQSITTSVVVAQKAASWIVVAISFLHCQVFAEQSAASLPASESWFVIALDNKPVGYEQLQTESVIVSGEHRIACQRRTRIYLKRLGQKIDLTAMLWTQQTPDGRLWSFRMQRADGEGGRTERSGQWMPNRQVFRITERVAGSLQHTDLQTRDSPRSPIASSWLPVVLKGERSSTTARVFFPESSEIVFISTSKRRHQSLRLGEKRFENVMEYRFTPQLDPARRTQIFCDATGRPLASETGLLGGALTLRATTADDALRTAKGDMLNLDVLALIPVNKPLSPSTSISETVVDLSVRDGLLPQIPSTRWQRVESVNAATSRITLLRPDRELRRHVAASFTSRSHEIPESPWMPLDDPELRRMTTSTVSGMTDPTQICLSLEDAVRRKLRYSAFSTSLRPAAEIARTLRGDCTEHAVLLAALIRNAGIPARIAAGLAHSNKQLGFSGHVWVEAFIRDTWVPFDSAIPRQSRAVHHIKLTDSLLTGKGDSGISLFLPMLDLAGQATITVVSEK